MKLTLLDVDFSKFHLDDPTVELTQIVKKRSNVALGEKFVYLDNMQRCDNKACVVTASPSSMPGNWEAFCVMCKTKPEPVYVPGTFVYKINNQIEITPEQLYGCTSARIEADLKGEKHRAVGFGIAIKDQKILIPGGLVRFADDTCIDYYIRNRDCEEAGTWGIFLPIRLIVEPV